MSRAATTLTVSTDKSVYDYGARARLTVHLGPTFNRRTASVYLRDTRTGVTSLVGAGRVDPRGNLVLAASVKSRSVITVRFDGDYRYRPTSATRTVAVRSRVSISVSGYSRRAGDVYLVPRSVSPTLTVHVLPGRPGSCVRMDAEGYFGGAWHRGSPLTCAVLASDSSVRVRFVSPGMPGRTRVRASVAANSYNAATAGPWVYITFT